MNPAITGKTSLNIGTQPKKQLRSLTAATVSAFDISPRMKDCMPGETSDDDGESWVLLDASLQMPFSPFL